ncbi:hypothetical protein SAMN04490201_2492 [Pseudomonas psychrophila]|uniref:Uncharacterized protein n=1 Tax=Pseudomonas psychrophila TaxID=122355 RepID=A0ABY0VTB9_9PSED|nr:hypothetical protein SAMN04490201_2492 [Pseudomonas psychrophila]
MGKKLFNLYFTCRVVGEQPVTADADRQGVSIG